MVERNGETYLTRREAEILIEGGVERAKTAAEAHVARWDAHDGQHEMEQLAVRTALEAVARERQIHASAHEREHSAHEHVHDLNARAVDKAEKGVEDRLHVMNEFREQLRAQAQTFITRDLSEEKHAEKEKMIALMRDDINRRFEELGARIIELEKYDVAQKGKFTGVGTSLGWIIAGLGVVATILTIVIIVTNVLTAV